MIYAQGDPRWANVSVGFSSSTMAAVGCALTAIAQATELFAARSVHVRAHTPPEVNQSGRTCDPPAFAKGSAAAVLPLVGKAVGLAIADRTDVDRTSGNVAAVLDVVERTLGNRGVLLAHVDHDAKRATGDWDGDHWVLIHLADGDAVKILDPCGGKERWLSRKTLVGPSPFGASSPYQVRGVRPVFPLIG